MGKFITHITLIYITFILSGFLCPQKVYAEFSSNAIQFQGLIDLRTGYTDSAKSFHDDGLGKLRYGGQDSDDDRSFGTIGEAGLIVKSRLSDALKASAYLKYDPQQHSPVDIIEFFFTYAPESEGVFRGIKAGLFFPPISLENTSVGWNSPYTITYSAINSWIGEELRILGPQAKWRTNIRDHSFTLLSGTFWANDPAGSLLGFRGWSMNDQKTGLFDRIPLAPVDSIQWSGTFSKQEARVEPYEEIDGRPGIYGSVHYRYLDRLTLELMYYDNLAEQSTLQDGQYAWETNFLHLSATYQFQNGIKLLHQFMYGRSLMGLGNAVDIDFWSYYFLITRSFNRHRLSLRFDQFGVIDNDTTPDDNNDEFGTSWTAAYSYRFNSKHLVMIEALNVDSERDARSQISRPSEENEFLLQASYRYFF